MELRSEEGPGLFISPVAYQFVPFKYIDDANWLKIAGRAETPHHSWNFECPALTIEEAKRFAKWLRRVVNGGIQPVRDPETGEDLDPQSFGASAIGFTEPYLAFMLLARDTESVTLRAVVSTQSGPPESEAPLDEELIDLILPNQSVVAAVQVWEEELAGFPERTLQKFSLRAVWAAFRYRRYAQS